jgi:hypothetical protein
MFWIAHLYNSASSYATISSFWSYLKKANSSLNIVTYYMNLG